ncbi:hypothetical protein AWW68_14265 [Roseivirga spongicola]|uniref:Uncharacterized protein n=1 Tax=Roseivirga spongicola TaxID=333140 RepID=A0A150X562_9BACT|nr:MULTISPECIES: hypothetical protein [Roseivirga]KYG73833.1 hypothetical protein AWW68_14265 [Roseivirga spongicola]MBO6660125.1 hypothetical protein [Roseivirga sp.]MBO6761791.1 hypothetical protein [Roseivirga sp.]MBO6907138.1 hypothetical protein [Roseivirga sp.]
MTDTVKKTKLGTVTKIRSNSGKENERVYIKIRTEEEEKGETQEKDYWCWVIPDNEGAKWIIQIALAAKINNLSIYMLGKEVQDSNEVRYQILEFGIE